MSVLDSLRKGFSFFLLSMGVSSPAGKAKSAPKPLSKPDSGKP
jgi:hypothetical protein